MSPFNTVPSFVLAISCLVMRDLARVMHNHVLSSSDSRSDTNGICQWPFSDSYKAIKLLQNISSSLFTWSKEHIVYVLVSACQCAVSILDIVKVIICICFLLTIHSVYKAGTKQY